MGEDKRICVWSAFCSELLIANVDNTGGKFRTSKLLLLGKASTSLRNSLQNFISSLHNCWEVSKASRPLLNIQTFPCEVFHDCWALGFLWKHGCFNLYCVVIGQIHPKEGGKSFWKGGITGKLHRTQCVVLQS